MDKIYQKLSEERDSFSKSLQKIASCVYDDPNLFAIYSAAEVGKQIGVSETTVIRFCKKLGYSGYSALQEEIRKHLFQKSSLTDFKEEKSIETDGKTSVNKLMLKDMESIQKTMDKIPDASFEKAVDQLAAADRVLVTGARMSYSLASWFAFSLDIVVGGTRLFQPGMDDILLRVSELTRKSVVVVFSFHRYVKETLHIARLAREQGAYVIAFTDSPMSPIAGCADLLLLIQLKYTSTLDVGPVVMSLAKAMVSAISLQNESQFNERVQRFDAINGEDFFNGV